MSKRKHGPWWSPRPLCTYISRRSSGAASLPLLPLYPPDPPRSLAMPVVVGLPRRAQYVYVRVCIYVCVCVCVYEGVQCLVTLLHSLPLLLIHRAGTLWVAGSWFSLSCSASGSGVTNECSVCMYVVTCIFGCDAIYTTQPLPTSHSM